MWPNNFHFSHLSLSSVSTTFIFGPASLNDVFSELSHAQGRKVKSQPPLPSHFKTPTSNTSCRDLQNGTSPHSADTFSHLVPHRDEALSQTPYRKEKSWKAFYVNLDQLELPPKREPASGRLCKWLPWQRHLCACHFVSGCKPFIWLICALLSHLIRCRILGRCT